jgi:hypothetical protein
MNLPAFFDSVRASIFNGSLSRKQVEGCEILLAAMQARGWTDQRWFAYVLATTFHETAATMQPIAEFGKGRGKPYGKPDPVTGQTYYGRGYVQMTWKENYARMDDRLGLPLVTDPDIALEELPASRIICEGMEHGLFTGVGLPRYFGPGVNEPVNARKIVNKLDRAALIAGYHARFLEAIEAAWTPAADPRVAWLAAMPPETLAWLNARP